MNGKDWRNNRRGEAKQEKAARKIKLAQQK